MSYLHTDHLGTPRYASNTSGTQVWNWSSDAFGNGAPSGTTTVNLRFAGQYFDAESSLHYNWNRYYDPTTGRYITSDPIGLAGGLNTYAYALANPVMFTDPEGLNPVVVGAAWCLANPICRTAAIALAKRAGISIAQAIQKVLNRDITLPPVQRVFPPLVIPGDYCPPSDPGGDDECDRLRRKVIEQKKLTDSLGKCKIGMTRDEISTRMAAFKELFYDRARRDSICFGGGDAGHRQAQTNASGAARRCADML